MQKTPALKSMFTSLIKAPSISATNPAIDQSNRDVITQLGNWLDDLGFKVEIAPLPQAPNKYNLIATLGEGSGGLVLAGHSDTVPCNENRWSSDPFKLTERDDRWFGLGVCDMKGFFPLIIEAVKPLLGQKLAQPLIILATADEESSMNGARALAEAGKPRGRFAVIGEPTGLKPISAHKGMMMEKIKIRGQAGHSSNPALGRNAIDSMHKVIGTIIEYRNKLAERYQNPLFSVPTPTLNLGCIHGGDNPNRICGGCDMEFDIRLLPGMCSSTLREELQQRIAPIAEQDQVEIELEAIFPSVEAFSAPAQSTLIDTCEKLTGQQAETVAFATEAPFLAGLGMDTIVLGPGDIAQAHQPDEYLALDRIEPTIDILRQLIQRFCLQSS